MAGSRASIRLRRLRQRFGIGAPRLTIKTHVAWYWRVLVLIAIFSVSLALAAWIYEAGKRIARFPGDDSAREVHSLRNYVMELDAELTKLRTKAGSGESSLLVERATQLKLATRVKSLEAENAALKEDLAFFEGLMSSSGGNEEPGLRIDRLRIEPDGEPGGFRYKMLLVNDAGSQLKESKGRIQWSIKLGRGGGAGESTIVLPSGEEENSPRFRFEIKRFLRLEGYFSVPPEAVVKSVEVRLVQDGAVRAKRSLSF